MARVVLTNGPQINANLRYSSNPPTCGRSDRWLFVLNNYTEAEVLKLTNRLTGSERVKYVVFGKEIAPTTGTPHLQGFIIINYRINLAGIIKLFDVKRNGVNPVHFRISTCKDVNDAAEYCKKDGDVFEHGTLPAASIQGRDTDLLACITAMKAGMINPSEIRERFPGTYSRHRQLLLELVRDYRRPRDCVLYPLRIWQADLYCLLRRPTNDRTVIFVVDPVGNSGKTWFHRYYRWLHPENSQMIPNSCFRDMAYMLEEDTTTLFVDVRRADHKVEYMFLEAVKDGEVDATKYNSHVKKLGPCHVVVFMNRQPSMEELSLDRYKIIDLTPALNLVANIPEPVIETETETQTIIELNDDGDSVIRELEIAVEREVYDLTSF